jgi:hypothetical protein
MRRISLAQRKGSNHNNKNDPVQSHYDRKIEYSLPKIRLDAISKKRTQIEYTSDFEKKCVAKLSTFQIYFVSNNSSFTGST